MHQRSNGLRKSLRLTDAGFGSGGAKKPPFHVRSVARALSPIT